MKKFGLVAATIAMLTAQTLSAGDMPSTAFLGFEAGMDRVNANDDLGRGYDSDDAYGAVRIGLQNADWRFMLQYNILQDADADGGSGEFDLYTGHVDYNFGKWQHDNGWDTRFYVGANLGYLDYSFGSMDDSGMTAGAETGFAFGNETVDLELGYRYIATIDMDYVDDFQMIYAGVNFKFKPTH
jgi:hypothetical protein